MEHAPSPEQIPLAARFRALREFLDASTTADLKALDEYLAVGVEHFQKEASKGGKDHEEWTRLATQFEYYKNGSYRKEKWILCLAQRKVFLDEATQYEAARKPKSALAYRQKANNWLALASACRRVPEGK